MLETVSWCDQGYSGGVTASLPSPAMSFLLPPSHTVWASPCTLGHNAARDSWCSEGQHCAAGRGESHQHPMGWSGVPILLPHSPSSPLTPTGPEDNERKPGHCRGQLCRHRHPHQAAAEVRAPWRRPTYHRASLPCPRPCNHLGMTPSPDRYQPLLYIAWLCPPAQWWGLEGSTPPLHSHLGMGSSVATPINSSAQSAFVSASPSGCAAWPSAGF